MAQAEPARRSRTPIALRCEACGSVVATTHAWERVTCACGSVTVSGRPWRPTVSWIARPGGGWSEAVLDELATADDAEADAAPRRIGYAPHQR